MIPPAAKDIVKPHVNKTTADLLQIEAFKKAHAILDGGLGKKVFVSEISYCISQETGISQEMLKGSRRSKGLIPARAAICILAQMAGYSLPRIGQLVGDRDHTTVLHLIRKYAKHEETMRLVNLVAKNLDLEMKD